MDQVHEPMIKQCIASMPLNNNVLKHNSCDSFCLIKNDQTLNQPNSKTVSLVLTRLTNTTNTYVHVLRCNSCDFMTLNTSNLKEHVKNKHPNSLGFATYTCSQCSSVSTERSLMEEHLRMYHRITDNATGKLIEKFHAPSSDLFGLTTTSLNNTLPITLTTAGATTGSSGLAVNLVNAIAAIQNAGRTQSQQNLTNLNVASSTNSPSTMATTTISLPITLNSSDNFKLEDRLGMPQEPLGGDSTSTTEVTSTTNSCPVFNISGSRRRKAANPGRLCIQTPKLIGQDSVDDDKLSPNKSNNNDPLKLDPLITCNAKSTPIKRSSSSECMNTLVEPDTNPTNPPSPKRQCKEDLNKQEEPNLTVLSDSGLIKSPIKSNTPSFVLSIGNNKNEVNTSITGLTKVSPSTTAFCSTPIPTVGAYSPGGPFLGQLIPLSGLPENLISSISTALLQGQQTNSTLHPAMSNTTTTIPVPLLDSHSEIPSTTTSAWVLTNPANSLTLNLNQPQTSLTALQPTLLLPVPTGLNDSALSTTLKSTSQSQETLTTPAHTTTNCTGILRLPDLLEALKCVTGQSGNLISSFSIPSTPLTIRPSVLPTLSAVSTQLSGLTTSTTSSNQNTFSLQAIPSSGSGTLANLVAHLAATTNSQILSSPMGTFSQVHSSTNTPSSGASTSTGTTLDLSGTVLSTIGGKVSTPVPQMGQATGGNSENEIVSNSNSGIGTDQALDMSVRSTGPLQSASARLVSSKCEEIQGTSDPSVLCNVNNVAEALNAALKGGFKQRLIQSIEVPVSSLLANPAHCLTAIANSISNLPNSNEISGISSNAVESNLNNVLLKKQLSNPITTASLPSASLSSSPSTTLVSNSETPNSNHANGSKLEPLTPVQSSEPVNNTITCQSLAPSGVLNIAQLQAIMAALANSNAVSISLPVTSTLSTTPSTTAHVCPNSVSSSSMSLQSPNLLTMACQPHFLTSTSSMNTTVNPTTTVNSATISGLETGTTATLLPTLNSLTNVCGLTLAGVSNLPSTSVTALTPPISANITSINSGLKGITVPPGECISLTGILSGNMSNMQSNPGHFGSTVVGNPALINLISANRSSAQSNVTLGPTTAARLLTNLATSTSVANLFPVISNGIPGNTGNLCTNTVLGTTSIQNGTINLLDSQHALLAAAAASAVQNLQRPVGQTNANVNQISLTNLKTPLLNTTATSGRQPGTTSAPVINLLDPRTSLQLRVADSSTSSTTIMTSNNPTNSFNTNGETQVQDSDQSETISERNEWNSNEYTKRRKVLDNSANHTPELDTSSPFHSQADDDWDADADDNNNNNHNTTGHPSIYPRRTDTSLAHDTDLTIQLDSPPSTNYSSQSSGHLGSSSKRPLGISRSGSGRSRNMHGLGDHGQHLRPHRQNFTPNQNRILTEWYQLHQAKPYPSTDDTKELATISGLSYSQVKKWFANKRARSTSNGLPKPTPPLAPDSSTDPSAAAAIVAAAMAAATSATIGVDHVDPDTHPLQPYLLSPQALESLTTISLNNNLDVHNSSLKDSKDESDIEFTKSCDYYENVTKDETFLLSDSVEKANHPDNTDTETASNESRLQDLGQELGDNLEDTVQNDGDSVLIIDSEIPEVHPNPRKLVDGEDGSYLPSSPPTLEVHISQRVNSPGSIPDASVTNEDVIMSDETKSFQNDLSSETSDLLQQHQEQELNTSDEAIDSTSSLSSSIGLQKDKSISNGPVNLEAHWVK